MSTKETEGLPFDHDHEKYRCCCYGMHVKTGSYIIAIISAFYVISNLVLKAVGLSDIGWNWELLFLVVDSVAILCLLGGIYFEKAALLQPFVVLTILTLSFLILLCFFFFSAWLDSNSYASEYIEMQIRDGLQETAEILAVEQQYVIPLLAAIITFSLAIAVVIHIWFLFIIVRCAQYFRDLEPVKLNLSKGYRVETLSNSNIFDHVSVHC
ncbi:unnamed protein product [Dracunculus medinensis]|uniref:Lysosomal-associated transmembrane protein 4A n=1 Tax=Dracunculus medinensis TaxID=318479 RepID=A0A0N4UKA7_DRAME|nr:unnamed protein product [Dracunculus medinensis]